MDTDNTIIQSADMNILYIGSFRLPNFDAGAARVLNIGRSLILSGHKVSYISWGGSYRECDRQKNNTYCIDGMEYTITHELDCNGGIIAKIRTKLKRGHTTLSILKSMKTLPDAIIMYNPGYWFTVKMLDFCSKNKIFLVSDITEWHANNELHLIDIPPYWYNMTYLQRQVKNKILISSYLNDYYSESHNIIIPATCNSADEKWSYSPNNDFIDCNFTGITFIYAGTPARKDKLHTAINALQKLIDEGADIRFLILGVSRESYIKKSGKLITTEKLSDKIKFIGRVSQDAVPSFYSMSDFMILIREDNRKSNAGFPTKFAESMMSGTPVIANRTSDIGKYLISGYNGIMLSDDSSEGLYHTIKTKVLPMSKNERMQMKQNALATGKEEFDCHQYGKCVNDFITTLKQI